MSVGGYIHINMYLAVYGPEIIGSFGLEEKGKNIKKTKQNKSCLWSRKNKLWWFEECATRSNRPLFKRGGHFLERLLGVIFKICFVHWARGGGQLSLILQV